VARLCECCHYHWKVVFSGVSSSLAFWLCHVTMSTAKLAVKLCQFLLKSERIVSILTQKNEFLSLLHFVKHIYVRISCNEWCQNSTSAANFCLKICILRKQNISSCLIYVFGRFLTYFESYASSVIRKDTTVVLHQANSFPQAGLGISCPILSMILCGQTQV